MDIKDLLKKEEGFLAEGKLLEGGLLKGFFFFFAEGRIAEGKRIAKGELLKRNC
jgi:hypothetical protein